MNSPFIEPDAVFQALLAKPGRSERRKALENIHRICSQRHRSGEVDFTISMVGKLCEEAGIIKGRALYNKQSADYRTLICAWSVFSSKGQSASAGSKASRLAAERDELKVQVELAKVHNELHKLESEHRLAEATAPAKAPRGRPLKHVDAWRLSDKDRQALKASISADFLAGQGWRRGPNGGILDAAGATIYDEAYVQAIKKVLANEEKAA